MTIVSFLFNSRMLKLNFIIIFKRALVFSRNKEKNISGCFLHFRNTAEHLVTAK